MELLDGTSQQRVWCEMFDPDGRRLAGGWCYPIVSPGDLVCLSQLDHPGTVVQRCLLSAVLHVELRTATGDRWTAQLRQVAFDLLMGRTCVLQIAEKIDVASTHNALTHAGSAA